MRLNSANQLDMSWKMEYMVFRILYRLKMKELAMRLNCSLALIIVCLTVFPSLVWGNMTGGPVTKAGGIFFPY